MSVENGVDLSVIDFSKLDMGNEVVEAASSADKKDASDASVEVESFQAEKEASSDEASSDEASSEEDAKKTPLEKKVEEENQSQQKPKKPMPQHIPKARFDEAVGKERAARTAAEQRAKELEQQLRERETRATQVVQRSERVIALDKQIDDLEDQRDKLLLDGEQGKATELSKQLRALNREVARIEAQEESTEIVSQTLERERLQVCIAKWEAEYPELNPSSESFDKDLTDMIVAYQHNLVGIGESPSRALNVAVEKLMSRMKPSQVYGQEGESEGLGKSKSTSEERTKEQIAHALATQSKQPPSVQNIGLDSDKVGMVNLPDVTKMSYEEYEALPESTKARLRGDIL